MKQKKTSFGKVLIFLSFFVILIGAIVSIGETTGYVDGSNNIVVPHSDDKITIVTKDDNKDLVVDDKGNIVKQGENNVKRIKAELEDLKNKDCIKEAPGLNREISQNIESIKKEEKAEFRTMPITEIENIVDKWNPDSEGNWVRQLINLKVGIKRKEFEIKNRDDIDKKNQNKQQKENDKAKKKFSNCGIRQGTCRF